MMRSTAEVTRSRCSALVTYSRTARRAASCMEVPSRTARRRNASCSFSVSLSVIAMRRMVSSRYQEQKEARRRLPKAERHTSASARPQESWSRHPLLPNRPRRLRRHRPRPHRFPARRPQSDQQRARNSALSVSAMTISSTSATSAFEASAELTVDVVGQPDDAVRGYRLWITAETGGDWMDALTDGDINCAL